MTRRKPRAEDYHFDLEIEKTLRRRRKLIHEQMALEDNQQQPNLNEDRMNERGNMNAADVPVVVLSTVAGNPLQPPMQHPAAQRQRTIRDYLEEDLDRYNSAIVIN